MKKIILPIAGLCIASSIYAKDYATYDKPNKNAQKIGMISDSDRNYTPIFAKKHWIELMNVKTGEVVWVRNHANKKRHYSNNHISDIFSSLDAQQKQMQKDFQKMNKYFNQQMKQTGTSLGSANSGSTSTYYTKSSSVTTSPDGKTAKVTEKINDNGNIKTVTKEVPISEVQSVKF